MHDALNKRTLNCTCTCSRQKTRTVLAIGTWSDSCVLWNRSETTDMREDGVEDTRIGMILLYWFTEPGACTSWDIGHGSFNREWTLAIPCGETSI